MDFCNGLQRLPTIALTAIGIACLLPCLADAQELTLGETDFPNSGHADAQEAFLRGLLLLHSFEYPDSRAAFQEAQSIDPEFAMAYWGEALTHNHPLWAQQDLESARAALSKLGPDPEARLARAPTEREKDYLRALDVLLGDGEKLDRDIAYAEAMAALASRYPDDLDAKAFQALALLGTCHDGRHVPTYMKAAAIAEEVFSANPHHPGAAHYLIHSYDDPTHAPLGLRAARAYSKIAPSASHALHMPSHVFVALGMWDDVVEMNTRSFQAEKEHMARIGRPIGGHGFHPLSWLAYGYLQQGRYEDAAALLDSMVVYEGLNPVVRARSYLAAMRATHLVETRDWTGSAAVIRVDSTGLWQPSKAGDYFSVAASGLARGDRAAATAARDQIRLLTEDMLARDRVDGGNGHEADRMRIIGLELDALLHLDAGETDKALAAAAEAARADEQLPYEYGPPWPVVKPSGELYGEILLGLDRPAEAQEEFEKSLYAAPGRSLSLLGLVQAANRAGDTRAAAQALRHLEANWAQADPDVLEFVAELRATSGMSDQEKP
jgi:tetratricopeptide (TPR) repeat protein